MTSKKSTSKAFRLTLSSLGQKLGVCSLIFSVALGCNASIPQGKVYPTRAKALKDPGSIQLADASPVEMKKLALAGDLSTLVEATLAVKIAGELAISEKDDPAQFNLVSPMKKIYIPAREAVPTDPAASMPNGEVPPNGQARGPNGEAIPGGQARNPTGETGPGGQARNPTGEIIPGIQARKPTGEIIPGIQARNPTGEIVPGSSGGLPGQGAGGGGAPGQGGMVGGGVPGQGGVPGGGGAPGQGGMVGGGAPGQGGVPGGGGVPGQGGMPGGGAPGQGGMAGGGVPGQGGMPGGGMPGGGMPGGGMPGGGMPGGGMPGGGMPGQGGNPGGGVPSQGGATCESHKLYITQMGNPGVIESPAVGLLNRINKYEQRLVAFVRAPNATGLQIRFHFANAIDSLAMMLSDADIERYAGDIGYWGGPQVETSAISVFNKHNKTPDEKAYEQRVLQAAQTMGDFTDYSYPADRLQKINVLGQEGFFLDNNLLFPPQRSRFRDGRVHRFEFRAIGRSGQPEGAVCDIVIQWFDPIVFDLKGQGSLKTVSVKDSSARFDMEGTGVKVPTGWITPDYGFLALDLNKNGKIDDGKELFGDTNVLDNGRKAKNGYEALAQYDTQKKGYLDESSPIFSQLKMWIDRNSDGISTPNELSSLSEHGITKILVQHLRRPNRLWEDAAGNVVKYESKFFGPSHCGTEGCRTFDVFFETAPVNASKK